MALIALKPGYEGEVKDRVENFHGNQLLYIGWEDHLMFGAPLALALPPDTPFRALVEKIIPDLYSDHPESSKINWDTVQWFRSGQPFVPDLDKSLVQNGLDHKAVIRFRTPGLTGIKGSCS